MNVKRFVGKNAREAMAQVRAAWGDDAVVLANRPIPGGVEILALPGLADVPVEPAAPRARRQAQPALQAQPQPEPQAPAEPMSTVSFERYVRERQRQADLEQQQADALLQSAAPTPAPLAAARTPARPVPRPAPLEPARFAASELGEAMEEGNSPAARAARPDAARAYLNTRDATVDTSELLMSELRAMRGMISAQLASLSWFDNVRRNPVQTAMLRLLLGNGFSPALARHLVDRLPAGADEARAEDWLAEALARNIQCAEADALTTQGGTFALVGPTGVGKTTTTAKIAAHFALRHGAASVGLITADTYRMAAGDQLSAFGRLLGIPVHTARDPASLQDLLGLFEKKKLVLIDTVGMGQRDRRTKELFAALPSASVTRLLVLNASAQAETLDEVVQAYGEGPGTRCVVSKLDEAVKTGAVVDLAIRRKLRLEGVANGQRVPEDWHVASARLLARKALARQAANVFTPDDAELGLLLTTPPSPAMGTGAGAFAQAAAGAGFAGFTGEVGHA